MKKEILISSTKALREGGRQIEWYNNNILSSNKTKMSNMRIKSFGGIHYLYPSISVWFSQKKKKNLLAFTPNVKILGSNMVSRNFENGSKNMKKKYMSTWY